ncbi:MAG: hypothetical protein IPK32_11835 [Verrucomicrobiaceae bacterium]|nr:hypothetical protein [Verrucomicrobiaceae bacterium]
MKSIGKLLLALLTLSAAPSFGATGMFGSFLFVDTNQSGGFTSSEYYGANEPDPDTLAALSGANFGSFTQGSSVIIAGEVLTYKNSGGDVYGGNVNWRVYSSGSPSGSYNVFALGWTSDATFGAADGQTFSGSGDQKWAQSASTPNILSGLTPGNYSLEVYFDGTGNEGTFYNNNSGNNFVSNFSVVAAPEPSKALFAGLGLGTLLLRRRRK